MATYQNTEHRGDENLIGASFLDGNILMYGLSRTELVIEVLRLLALMAHNKMPAQLKHVLLPGTLHASTHWAQNVGYVINVIDDKAGVFLLKAYRTRECVYGGGYVCDTSRIRGAATITRLNDKVMIEKRTGIFADNLVTTELRRLLPNVLLERPTRPKLVAALYKDGRPAFLAISDFISKDERAKYADKYDYVEVPQQD